MTGMFNGEPSPFGPPPTWKWAERPVVRDAKVGAIMCITDAESDGKPYNLIHLGYGLWSFVADESTADWNLEPDQMTLVAADLMTHTILFGVTDPGVEPSWSTVRLSQVANSDMPDRGIKYHMKRYFTDDGDIVAHDVVGEIVSDELGMARLGNQSYRVECVCGKSHVIGANATVEVLN